MLNTAPASLGIVIPVHDEAASVEELARRCRLAAASTALPHRLLLVDDASRDDTPRILDRLHDQGVLDVLHLPANRGQLGATMAGLARVTGDIVVVLDGDLQDPPEVIPVLVRALQESAADVGVAYAVKGTTGGPAWYRAGHAVHSALLHLLAGGLLPAGAGSFCALRREVVVKLVRQDARQGNLSACVASLGVDWRSVPFRKESRRDGASRVGPAGLARESLASLARMAVLRGRTLLRMRGDR